MMVPYSSTSEGSGDAHAQLQVRSLAGAFAGATEVD